MFFPLSYKHCGAIHCTPSNVALNPYDDSWITANATANSVTVFPQTLGFFCSFFSISLSTPLNSRCPGLSFSPSSPLHSQASLTLTWSTHFFPWFSHVALHMSAREALWPTSISVTCQDLWEMESKPNSSESVLLKLTPGLLCDVIDEHPCTLPPRNHTSLLHASLSSPHLLLLPLLSWFSLPLHISPVFYTALVGSCWSFIQALIEIWFPKN